jgi:hypothetical protein
MTAYRTPKNSLDFDTFTLHEVYVDLNIDALRHIAKDAQVLVIRVSGLNSNSGRPVSRTLRIPVDLLKEREETYDNGDPFA